MSRKSLIKSQVDSFLKQQSDHAWLMTPLEGGGGCDHFKNTVVYSTFPGSVSRDDFSYYIDMTFSDIEPSIRTKMKGLLVTNQHSFHSEDVMFNYGVANSTISASLIQIIGQKNEYNELEILVGFVSLIRKPCVGWHFNQDYWKSDKQRVQRGLQYIFGNEAQKEIEYT